MDHIRCRISSRALVLFGVGALSLGAAGCVTVQPWQRARLAHPCMTFDADGAQTAYEAHWQESREGAAGGLGVQSGGCGCK
jgi:Domain of unknown function (DUF4266)